MSLFSIIANYLFYRIQKRQFNCAEFHRLALQSRKLQEDGWRPQWFEQEGEDGPYHYKGGYWEAREQGNWDDCPNIFGEIIEDPDSLTEDS